MPTILSNVTVAGVTRAFYAGMAGTPLLWPKYCQLMDMRTNVEPLAFPGFLPQPRQFIDGRSIQGIRDFTYNITSNEYELTLLIDQNTVEDDQTGTVMQRIQETGTAWEEYKNYLFAQLLVNGATSGNNGFDGTTYYNASRTIGNSGTINNKSSNAATTGTIPIITEILPVLQTDLAAMALFGDDQGRPYNSMAMRRKSIVIPPVYEKPFVESVNSTIVPNTAGTASTDNPWGRGLAEIDVCPYLTATNKNYINFIGAPVRKPFIMAKRNEFTLSVFNDQKNIDLNHGLLIMARQRYIMTYGDPRMSFEETWT